MKFGKLMTKIICSAICLFLVVVSGGCSSDNNNESQTTEPVTLNGETESVDPSTVAALRIYDSTAENLLYTATWADTDVTDAFQKLVDNYTGVPGERTDAGDFVVEYVGYDAYSTRWYDLWLEEDGSIQFAQNKIKSMSFDGSGVRQSGAMTVDEFCELTGLSPVE